MSSSDRLHLGAAYYPEHWPEERWAEDIRLMREAGMTVARMAEFAWSALEPAAGEFHLDWLDRAISALDDAGIVSVLSTPTAAPPAWLIDQHPSALAVGKNGRRVQFGNRCHYCVNAPEFHTATRRIVAAMANRFGNDARVIGWQLDNEYHRVCYCDYCRAMFQHYLEKKFGSLDALNERWTTRYWSQTYSAWDQIPIPIGQHNPGLMLAFKQFITESYRQFQQLQLDALRPHLPDGVWVAHNFMGWYDGFDHYAMAKDLDLASWDWYAPSGHNDYLTSGAKHDLTRGFKQRNFWVMETQPGSVNWAPINSPLDKGEARAMAWHAVAHGADAVLYWQWRSALNGQEQYHGSLVDQSGQPRPFYKEVRQLGHEFATISPLLAGSRTSARVALLNDYDSRWSVQWQKHHRDFDYVNHFNHYYRPFAARNIPTDIISADAPLKGYRLVIAPALLIVNEHRVEQLSDFVKRGGHLILTIRCGMKDEYNGLLPTRQPGPLAEIAGVEVEEYYALQDTVPVTGNWFSGVSRLWAERLRMLDETRAVAIARYGESNGWLDDQIAIAVHPHGRGLVYSVGAYLDQATQQAFIDHVVKTTNIKPAMETPKGVEARRWINAEGTKGFIIINHTRAKQLVQLPQAMREHLDERTLETELELGPYGVAVLTRLT